MKGSKRLPHDKDESLGIKNEVYPLLATASTGSSTSSNSPSSKTAKLNCSFSAGTCNTSIILVALLFLLCGALTALVVVRVAHENHQTIQSSSRSTSIASLSRVPRCQGVPCFLNPEQQQQQERIQVPLDRPGFPSYSTYAGSSSLNVTYDSRSLLINSTRVLFLSGSMHPVRATRATWELALDEAVRQGLNMITLYTFWAAHQPFPDQPLDWRLPQQSVHDDCKSRSSSYDSGSSGSSDRNMCEEWTLAGAISAAAKRGLFVHVRIGPYVCAEYAYGGIPEWLPLKYPTMNMRRFDREWLHAMQEFVSATVDYLTSHQLWAHQGGPVVLAQIENELQNDDACEACAASLLDVDPSNEELHLDDMFTTRDDRLPGAGSSSRRRRQQQEQLLHKPTVQDYADWCGQLAHDLVPDVVWTMCNGLSANTTIETFNGDSFGANWLEYHGASGRIQVIQPALWTENEGGFQIWGDNSNKPTDYFWGQTSRDMAFYALQWFARGGTHLNYYMWWGGYNRGRSAAAGIMNLYASEAPLCPSGERRHPKFDHFQALHEAIIDVAPILLHAPTALLKNESVEFMNDDGAWEFGQNQMIFRYRATLATNKDDRPKKREAAFVENSSNGARLVRIFLWNNEERIFEMKPYSSVLFLDGVMRFDSSALPGPSLSYTRKILPDPVGLMDWASWIEPVGASSESPFSKIATKPVEQTALIVNASISSDYVWYEVDFNLPLDLDAATLSIQTQQANAMIVYIDDELVGYADTHHHTEGDVTLNFPFSHFIANGSVHKLSILSESLGHGNGMGSFGMSTTRAKEKGITGNVDLLSAAYNTSLVDGRREWRMHAGLHGEHGVSLGAGALARMRREDLENSHLEAVDDDSGRTRCGGLWSSARFNTPRYDSSYQSLFLDIVSGRGHLWLNGVDLGRYWNITRGETLEFSQRYYFLPPDFLSNNGSLNELLVFDVFGAASGTVSSRLVLSWVEPSENESFADEVGFALACLS